MTDLTGHWFDCTRDDDTQRTYIFQTRPGEEKNSPKPIPGCLNRWLIRVMCSGRVEPAFILEALKDGAYGVLITGCHIGDCHYIDGNRNAEVRINNTIDALKYLGLDGRLRLEWVSASEGARFAEASKSLQKRSRNLDRVR